MDALVARYASAHDDFFFDENADTVQRHLNTKPTHAHQFSLAPIAQVSDGIEPSINPSQLSVEREKERGEVGG